MAQNAGLITTEVGTALLVRETADADNEFGAGDDTTIASSPHRPTSAALTDNSGTAPLREADEIALLQRD